MKKRIMAFGLMLALAASLWSGACFAQADDIESWGDSGDFYGAVNDPENIWLAAMEVYSWFTIKPLDADPDLLSADGSMGRVLDDRFQSLEALEAFAHFYFSDSIVRELLSYGLYTQEDGLLYASFEGRGVDEQIAETEVTLAEDSESRTVLSVWVRYFAPNEFGISEETHTFVREFIDGEWKFVEFPFFW